MKGNLTRELVDILFPVHGRTSCDDDHTVNGYVVNEDGHARCSRCLALRNIDERLDNFKIEATIRVIPDPEEVKKRALAKLTPLERQTLGL